MPIVGLLLLLVLHELASFYVNHSLHTVSLEYFNLSGIRSDTIEPKSYRLFSFLGRFGRNEKFLKRPNFCLSMLLFGVVFSTF